MTKYKDITPEELKEHFEIFKPRQVLEQEYLTEQELEEIDKEIAERYKELKELEDWN